MKKWADKYGIKIDVVQVNDYVESINQYTAGGFDALTVTNMDALSTPAVGGVDTTAVIVGDFSNGNDAVILKNKGKLADIKGQKVNLVEFSVSHYLLARALSSVGMKEKDVKVVNTSDADMAGAWKTKDVTSVVTWNPIVEEVLADKAAHKVFDSSQIPGEIIDLTVANSETLKDNPDFGKALVGIWYETLALMVAQSPKAKPLARPWARPPERIWLGLTHSWRPPNYSTRPQQPAPSPRARKSAQPWTRSGAFCSNTNFWEITLSLRTWWASSSPMAKSLATRRT